MKIICSICNKTTTWEENPWRPFCSNQCRMIDLGSWLSDEYRIAGKKEEEEDENSET